MKNFLLAFGLAMTLFVSSGYAQDQNSQVKCAPADATISKLQEDGFEIKSLARLGSKDKTYRVIATFANSDGNWAQLMLIDDTKNKIACLLGAGSEFVIEKPNAD